MLVFSWETENKLSERQLASYSACVWLYVLDLVLGEAAFAALSAAAEAALYLYSPNHGIQDSTSTPTPSPS